MRTQPVRQVLRVLRVASVSAFPRMKRPQTEVDQTPLAALIAPIPLWRRALPNTFPATILYGLLPAVGGNVFGRARRFLAKWGEQAAALGWTPRDLFGLQKSPDQPHPSYRRLSRYDETGLIWLLQ